MTGQELKELMETVLPDSVLQRAVDAAGFEQRERKRDALKFLRAMLASASSPAGGRQADIMRTYFENGAPRIACGSFYDWFGPPLEEVVRELAETALAYAANQPEDRTGNPRSSASCAAMSRAPSCPAPNWTSSSPTDVLTLGNAIDADVTVGPERIPMRLCGVHVPERGYCFYLTNLSRSLGPRQVADIYRVRWEMELNNKLDKSSHRLDEIDTRTAAAVHALIHATIIASVLVGFIVHCHTRAIAQTNSTTRTQPPLHHGLVARMLATCAFRIADALELHGPEADVQWEHLAAVIVHAGKDPNWGRKPSILDQFRGRPVLPSSRPRRATLPKRA